MGQMKIYEAIRKVALSCAKSGDVQTRADLAYELKDMGIASEDDARLSEMVYRAYLHYNRDNDILKSFVTNDGASSIVDQYEVNAHLDDDNLQEALSVIEKDLSLAKIRVELFVKLVIRQRVIFYQAVHIVGAIYAPNLGIYISYTFCKAGIAENIQNQLILRGVAVVALANDYDVGLLE